MRERRALRRAALVVTAALLGLPALTAVQSAAAAARTGPKAVHQAYAVPADGMLTLAGRGFGHGHGMSQWGAYGAAKVDGLTATRILSFYYPHTTIGTEARKRHVRVLLSATDSSTTGYLQVLPAAGLTVTYAGTAHLLPTTDTDAGTGSAQPVTAWRVSRSQGELQLREQVAGTWRTTAQGIGDTVAFTDSASQVPVGVGSGSAVYRGRVSAELQAGLVEAVNRLKIEQYLRSVVPAEMPASWPAATLQAQAVAARTYAAHALAHPKASWYVVDGDTRDQAYGGVGVETAATTAATKATAGQVIESGGVPVFAQFAAADGGWTVSGGAAYLPAQKDPYDGAVANNAHSWTATVPASDVESAWPALGTLTTITVTGRDGHGKWGGRVTTLTLTGTKATVSVTGQAFQSALQLRSPWWEPTQPPTASPTS